MENDRKAPGATKVKLGHETTRHIYKTTIGPVCMSEEEHDAYLEAREDLERDEDDEDR